LVSCFVIKSANIHGMSMIFDYEVNSSIQLCLLKCTRREVTIRPGYDTPWFETSICTCYHSRLLSLFLLFFCPRNSPLSESQIVQGKITDNGVICPLVNFWRRQIPFVLGLPNYTRVCVFFSKFTRCAY
jgi:hypothetical protein